jgi:hypothetical protein
MKPKIFNIAFIFPTLICLGLQTYSQNPAQTDFYKHFTGKLDTSMNLTLDLLSHNGTISGYYFYSFPEPGSPSTIHYGKTISVLGKISGETIDFNELNNQESQFSGRMENDKKISGFWQKNKNDKAVPFLIEEIYPKGSIPLSCYSVSAEHFLFKGDGAKKISPKAKININILFPMESNGNSTNDSLKKLISKYLLHNNESIGSPKSFIEKLRDNYFDSYIKSSEGIADVSNAESFNREKLITMQVAYNEKHLLSFILRKFAKTGNSSGIGMVKHFVFSSVLNRQLLIEDIFTNEGIAQLDNLLNEKLRKLNGIKAGESLTEAGFFTGEINHNNNFYINNDGIGFIYNVYEIAPGTSGTTSLFISFKELNESIIKPGVLPHFN